MVAEYQEEISQCLDDPDDVSIRMRALELITSMVDRQSLQPIINQLLSQLAPPTTTPLPSAIATLQAISQASPKPSSSAVQISQSPSYRLHLTTKLLSIISLDTYTNVSDFDWVISVLVDVAYVSGVDVGAEVKVMLLDIVGRVRSVRDFAVRTLEKVIGDEDFRERGRERTGEDGLIEAGVWVCGEYASSLASPLSAISSILSPTLPSSSSSLIALSIQAAAKIFGFHAANVSTSWSGDLSAETKNLVISIKKGLEPFLHWSEIEVQERAVELYQLFEFVQADLTSHVIQSRPNGETIPGVEGGFTEANPNPPYPKSLFLFQPLFSAHELISVAYKAQEAVRLPEGLDLDKMIVLGGGFDGVEDEVEEETEEEVDLGEGGGKGMDELRRVLREQERKGKGKKKKSELTEEEREAKEKRKAERRRRQAEDPYYLGGKEEDGDVDDIPIVRLDDSELPPTEEITAKKSRKSKIKTQKEPAPPPVFDKTGEMPEDAFVLPTPVRQLSPPPQNNGLASVDLLSGPEPPRSTSAFEEYKLDEKDEAVTPPAGGEVEVVRRFGPVATQSRRLLNGHFHSHSLSQTLVTSNNGQDTMEASINQNHLRDFVKILQCASKYGDELHMHAQKTRWELSVTNSSKSAYCLFKLEHHESATKRPSGFFSKYKLSGNERQKRSGIKCQILVKSVLSVLGKGSLNTVDRLDLRIVDEEDNLKSRKRKRGSQSQSRSQSRTEDDDEDEDEEEEGERREATFMIKLVCKYGVTKKHTLHLAASEFLRVEVDPDSTPSYFNITPKILKDWLDHFSATALGQSSSSRHNNETKGENQLGWRFGKEDIRLRSWEGAASMSQLSTEIRIKKADFEDGYWVEGEEVELTLPMREFRATLGLIDHFGSLLTVSFSKATQPVTLTTDIEGVEPDTVACSIFCAIATTTCDAFPDRASKIAARQPEQRGNDGATRAGSSEGGGGHIGRSRTGSEIPLSSENSRHTREPSNVRSERENTGSRAGSQPVSERNGSNYAEASASASVTGSGKKRQSSIIRRVQRPSLNFKSQDDGAGPSNGVGDSQPSQRSQHVRKPEGEQPLFTGTQQLSQQEVLSQTGFRNMDELIIAANGGDDDLDELTTSHEKEGSASGGKESGTGSTDSHGKDRAKDKENARLSSRHSDADLNDLTNPSKEKSESIQKLSDADLEELTTSKETAEDAMEVDDQDVEGDLQDENRPPSTRKSRSFGDVDSSIFPGHSEEVVEEEFEEDEGFPSTQHQSGGREDGSPQPSLPIATGLTLYLSKYHPLHLVMSLEDILPPLQNLGLGSSDDVAPPSAEGLAFHPAFDVIASSNIVLQANDKLCFRFSLDSLIRHSAFFHDLSSLPTGDASNIIELPTASSGGLLLVLSLVNVLDDDAVMLGELDVSQVKEAVPIIDAYDFTRVGKRLYLVLLARPGAGSVFDAFAFAAAIGDPFLAKAASENSLLHPIDSMSSWAQDLLEKYAADDLVRLKTLHWRRERGMYLLEDYIHHHEPMCNGPRPQGFTNKCRKGGGFDTSRAYYGDFDRLRSEVADNVIEAIRGLHSLRIESAIADTVDDLVGCEACAYRLRRTFCMGFTLYDHWFPDSI
ncbi:hypothetical protein P7C73_g4354, partial [Tremellales sp. Uapishka_1]